ncbi:hypothetical protein LEP1GSC041_1167 [Leptospira noguchii str. 2006001870]|nr:hypothetical protein LEP1GSC041_1167 [Leptospira noguchii str. 2006001870]
MKNPVLLSSTKPNTMNFYYKTLFEYKKSGFCYIVLNKTISLDFIDPA